MTPAGIARLAFAALMEEVDATPKPGLVDRANSGAHTDMDYHSFAASARALRPHFEIFARVGAEGAREAETALFNRLRPLGLAAEADMLAATGGANTHKGAIFALGLLAAASGRLIALGQPPTPLRLGRLTARMTAGLCRAELEGGGAGEPPTAGRRMFARYGALGARGEAESGFLNARRGLARLRRLLGRGVDKNTAYVRTLLGLMATVTDTNVLARHNLDTALALRARAAALSRRYSQAGVLALDRALIAGHISPGGCADLLSAAIFLQLMDETACAGRPLLRDKVQL